MNNLQGENKNNPSSSNRSTSITASFSGPIPPPGILMDYEKLQKGLAERIIKMAELQGDSRRELQVINTTAAIKHLERRDREAKVGQIFAFIICLLALGVGLFSIYKGYPFAGSFIATLGFSTTISAFIYGRKKENK